MEGFSREQRESIRKQKDFSVACRLPRLRFDDPDRDADDIDGVFAIAIGEIGCGQHVCNHKADCSYGWGYCLLLEELPENDGLSTYSVRVGVAQCLSVAFNSTDLQRILIL
jgi:hypothetical protein